MKFKYKNEKQRFEQVVDGCLIYRPGVLFRKQISTTITSRQLKECRNIQLGKKETDTSNLNLYANVMNEGDTMLPQMSAVILENCRLKNLNNKFFVLLIEIYG